ncbi:hypothetical protein D8I24_2902 (plasmid) [Cupriavidus necator H850]|uniref:hypothetical protein n=1 Tax=Cupriavidus necator TaxID=106590 RepID=UPI00129E47B4|nr:hypothetical protein [Cupriavidus necator]KAI3603395.1 hypothetical protein D8I24_2902 [Cupriavidus necator H850]
MSQVLGGIDRILARVGKRVVSSDARGETVTVEACSTVRAAPCPACHRINVGQPLIKAGKPWSEIVTKLGIKPD